MSFVDAVYGVIWASEVAVGRDAAGIAAAVWQVPFESGSFADLCCHPKAAASCCFTALCSLNGVALGTISGQGVAWEILARVPLLGMSRSAVLAYRPVRGNSGYIRLL